MLKNLHHSTKTISETINDLNRKGTNFVDAQFIWNTIRKYNILKQRIETGDILELIEFAEIFKGNLDKKITEIRINETSNNLFELVTKWMYANLTLPELHAVKQSNEKAFLIEPLTQQLFCNLPVWLNEQVQFILTATPEKIKARVDLLGKEICQKATFLHDILQANPERLETEKSQIQTQAMSFGTIQQTILNVQTRLSAINSLPVLTVNLWDFRSNYMSRPGPSTPLIELTNFSRVVYNAVNGTFDPKILQFHSE